MNEIHARFKLRSGAFTLDVEFQAPVAGITGLLGPSGAGKTTILRCIAGLSRAPLGFLSVNGTTWQDDPNGIFIPPHKRPVGYVFQEASLFPHLNVHGNLMYGLKRVPVSERHVQFEQAVNWLAIEPLLARKAHELSGGERQRVAIARALLCSPQLLLLDEPLSAVDESSRQEILPYLVRLHRDLSVPILLVSHATKEVARLADFVVHIRGGSVVGSGLPHMMLGAMAHNVSPEFGAVSVLDVVIASHDERCQLTELSGEFGTLWAPRLNEGIGEHARIQIAARDVSLGLNADHNSSILNQIAARVDQVDVVSPGQVLVRLSPSQGRGTSSLFSLVTLRSCEALGIKPGLHVYARVKGVSLF